VQHGILCRTEDESEAMPPVVAEYDQINLDSGGSNHHWALPALTRINSSAGKCAQDNVSWWFPVWRVIYARPNGWITNLIVVAADAGGT
jgi:hypothetical protein